jgi:hypothetical protein
MFCRFAAKRFNNKGRSCVLAIKVFGVLHFQNDVLKFPKSTKIEKEVTG